MKSCRCTVAKRALLWLFASAIAVGSSDISPFFQFYEPREAAEEAGDQANQKESTETGRAETVPLTQIKADQSEIAATTAAKAAGSYERKSITFLKAVWNEDQSASELSSGFNSSVAAQIHTFFKNQRFDKNTLPDELHRRFVSQAKQKIDRSAGKGKSFELLTQLVEEVLLPPILAAVEANAVRRAVGRLSDEQRNMMIVDKAKELGITAVELEAVRRSAFLVIPVVGEWSTSVAGVSITIGVAIWRIVEEDGVARAVRMKGIFASGTGLGGNSEAAVAAALQNLEQLINQQKDFRLTAQVAQVHGSEVESKIGPKEGVKVGKKMRLLVAETDEEGKRAEGGIGS